MKTVIHQLKTDGKTLDGMSYVIGCADGSLIAVDGGMPYGDAKILLDFLKKLTGSDKPVLDAWFFTHNHLDHTGAFFEMAEKYADQLTVRKLVVDFLSEEFYAAAQPACVPELRRFIEDQKRFPGLEVVTPSAGDVYSYGDTKIEILYTASDLPVIDGGRGNTVNDTSLVFRVHAAGQTVLFLGDVQKAGDDVMIARYGKALKSDVCQIAHHGCGASTSEFYSYVDPSVLLWPVGADRFDAVIRCVAADIFLLSSPNLEDVYLAGHGSVSLEMPIRARVAPFLPKIEKPVPKELEGEIVVPRAAAAPELDPAAPAWEDAIRLDAVNDVNPAKGEGAGNDSAFAKLLWADNALFMLLRFNKKIVFDPERHGSTNCDCIRAYITESPVTDPFTDWSVFRGDPRFENRLKFFPEPKTFSGTAQESSAPELCTSRVFTDGKGFTVCAKRSFSDRRSSGGLISVGVEFNGVREAGKQREYCLSFLEKTVLPYYEFPFRLVFARLG